MNNLSIAEKIMDNANQGYTPTLNRYIELEVISDYATKNSRGDLSLELDEIPKSEIANFFNMMMEHDPVAQQFMRDRMEVLIESRLPFVECENNYSAGMVPVQDNTTGEISWQKRY